VVSHLTLYTKPGCHLCEDALEALERLRREIAFEIRERDISLDDGLQAAYFDRIPVVALDGIELCEFLVEEDVVREALLAQQA
jgi:glutaredoxin